LTLQKLSPKSLTTPCPATSGAPLVGSNRILQQEQGGVATKVSTQAVSDRITILTLSRVQKDENRSRPAQAEKALIPDRHFPNWTQTASESRVQSGKNRSRPARAHKSMPSVGHFTRLDTGRLLIGSPSRSRTATGELCYAQLRRGVAGRIQYGKPSPRLNRALPVCVKESIDRCDGSDVE
jgi:hypothetical protein